MRALPGAFAALVLCATCPAAMAGPAWLAPVQISPQGDVASSPEIAVDPQGDAIVIFSDNTNSGPQTVFRPAGGTFEPPQTLSPSGVTPEIAMDSNGNAAAAWWVGPDGIQASFRPAGGAFAPGTAMSATSSGVPRIRFDAQGNALLLYVDNSELYASFRSRGGSFVPGSAIAGSGSGSIPGFRPGLAFDSQGNALAVWGQSDGSHNRIWEAYRPAGGSFGTAVAISASTENAAAPEVAVDPAGNAIAVWLQSSGTNQVAEAAFRPAGASSSFDAPQALSDPGSFIATPQIAFDAQGNALAVWSRHFWIEAAFRPAGGSFGAAKLISASDHNAIGARIAFDPQGNALAVWWDSDGTGMNDVTKFALRPPGGDFGAPQTISGNGIQQFDPRIATDGQGNAVAAWYRTDGSGGSLVEVAGYDAVAPALSNVIFPATSTPGTTLTFFGSSFDVWGPVTNGWDFGDGSGAAGSQVTHAYAGSGTYTARFTATDAAGNASSAQQAITITSPSSNSTQTPAAAAAPVLSALRLSPTRFRAAASGPTLSVAVGTTVSFSVSKAASVRFTAQRARPGRRVGRTCKAPTAKNRRAKRCTRFVNVGSFARAAAAGANRRRFSGRVRNKKLAPGGYRLAARATDSAGRASRTLTAPFRIVR